MFGWGGLTNDTDQRKCWAETHPNNDVFSAPCGKQIVSDLGLCAQHYKEIVGVEWEGERSHAAGV